MRLGIVVTIWNTNVIEFYVENLLNGISSQVVDGFIDVLFVVNKSSDDFALALAAKCKEYSNDKVSFSYISERDYHYHFSSMNLGFYVLSNHAQYDYFGYSADDVWLEQNNQVAIALKEFSDPEVALVSLRCEYDNTASFYPWYDEGMGEECIKVRLGECVNLQFMLFSREFMEAYNFRYIDMLTCFGTESLLSYVCAGVDKYWVLCRKTDLKNLKINPRKWTLGEKALKHRKKAGRNKVKGLTGWFVASEKSLQETIEHGYKLGLGFQGFVESLPSEDRAIYVYGIAHNPALYNDNEKCKNKEALYQYIKDNLFVLNPPYEERMSNIRKAGQFYLAWE